MIRKPSILVATLCTLAPTSVALAQAGAPGTQTSNVPAYHLMQLEVKTKDVSVETFETKTAAINDCSEVKAVAKELGGKMVRNRFVRASQMPSDLRAILKELPAGKATPVFSTDPAAARVLVLCNRV